MPAKHPVLIVIGGAVLLCGGLRAAARAGQVLLIDRTYTHNEKVGSHYNVTVRPDTPANWRVPINYAEGTLYLELEVQKKPDTKTIFIYQLCLSQGPYICTNFFSMSKAGTYNWSQAFPYKCCSSSYDYGRKPTSYSLIVKDSRGVLVESSAQYYPMDLHARVWVVSKGDAFHHPDESTPDGSASDGGGISPGDAGSPGDGAREPDTSLPAADTSSSGTPGVPDAAASGDAAGVPAHDAATGIPTPMVQGMASGCTVGKVDGHRPLGPDGCLPGAYLTLGLMLRRRKMHHRKSNVRGVLAPALASALAAVSAGCLVPGAGDRGDSGTGGTGAERNPGDMLGTGGFPGASPGSPAPVTTGRLARLSHAQWENTVRDLLRLDKLPGLSASFTGDAITGFDNNADQLLVSDGVRGDYERAAEILAARVARDPAALGRILPPALPTDPIAKARGFIQNLGPRAYRRPLSPDEIEDYLALFQRGAGLFDGTDTFAAGVEIVLGALMQSPHFLYRTELSTKVSNGRIALDDYEIAAKVAFALTNTMPDETVFAAAAAGDLHKPARLTAEATRLLDSARGEAVLDHFHRQVYMTSSYAHVQKDEKLFPVFAKWKATLPADMEQEALLFTRDIVKQQRGVADLLTAPYTFANKALAAVYGLPMTADLGATSYARVELDPAQRSGLLTRLGFLASRAGATDPHSIQRGVFVNQVVLCRELPPPVANVSPLPPQGKATTNRQLVELHTGKGTCGENCHYTLINPPGFAFENYDAVGAYRTADRGAAVDSSGIYTFDDGPRSFANGIEFSRQMAGSPEAHNCYARQLLSYLHSREFREGDNADSAWTTDLGSRSRTQGMNIRSMILELVTGPAFTTRTPGESLR